MAHEEFRRLVGLDARGMETLLDEWDEAAERPEAMNEADWWGHSPTPKQIGYVLALYKQVEHKPAAMAMLHSKHPELSWGNYLALKSEVGHRTKGYVGKLIDTLKGLVDHGAEQVAVPAGDPHDEAKEKARILELSNLLDLAYAAPPALDSVEKRHELIKNLENIKAEREKLLKETWHFFFALLPLSHDHFDGLTHKLLGPKQAHLSGSYIHGKYSDFEASLISLPTQHLVLLRERSKERRQAQLAALKDTAKLLGAHPTVNWYPVVQTSPDVSPFIPQTAFLKTKGMNAKEWAPVLDGMGLTGVLDLNHLVKKYLQTHQHELGPIASATQTHILHLARRLDPSDLKSALAISGISLRTTPGHADPIDTHALLKMSELEGQEVVAALGHAVQYAPRVTSQQISDILAQLYELGTDSYGLELPPDLQKKLQSSHLRELTRYEASLVLGALEGLKHEHSKSARQHAAIMGLSGLL